MSPAAAARHAVQASVSVNSGKVQHPMVTNLGLRLAELTGPINAATAPKYPRDTAAYSSGLLQRLLDMKVPIQKTVPVDQFSLLSLEDNSNSASRANPITRRRTTSY
jgi:hypothetical protein